MVNERKSLTRQEKNTMPRPKVIRIHYQCQFSDCNYDWQTRRDSPPARCPGCQRANWMHGDRAKQALLKQLTSATCEGKLTLKETPAVIEAEA